MFLICFDFDLRQNIFFKKSLILTGMLFLLFLYLSFFMTVFLSWCG